MKQHYHWLMIKVNKLQLTNSRLNWVSKLLQLLRDLWLMLQLNRLLKLLLLSKKWQLQNQHKKHNLLLKLQPLHHLPWKLAPLINQLPKPKRNSPNFKLKWMPIYRQSNRKESIKIKHWPFKVMIQPPNCKVWWTPSNLWREWPLLFHPNQILIRSKTWRIHLESRSLQRLCN